MRKLFLQLLSFVLCAGILAGGAYLSYIQSNFDDLKSDWDKIFSSPLFPDLNNGDETEQPGDDEEEPSDSDENPEGGEPSDSDETPEDAGDNA